MTRITTGRPARRTAQILGALGLLVAGTAPASASATGAASPHVVTGYPCTTNSSVNVPNAQVADGGKYLEPGQNICVNGYQFIDQRDGNLVIYNAANTALWSSHTAIGSPTTMVFQPDGNFVIYNGTKALWATGTYGHPTDYVCFQTDGNMVVYTNTNSGRTTCTGSSLWASHT